MTTNHIHSLIQKCLSTHCTEILNQWCESLDQADKFMLFRMTGDLRLTLRKYFDEIISSLTDSRITIPPLPKNPLPLDVARREVSILLEGKDTILKFVYSDLHLSGKDWLVAHKKLTEIFHRILRVNSESACDSCRWALDARLNEVKELSMSLQQAIKEKCHHGDENCTCGECI